MLCVSVTCIKHEGFKEEKEWRLVFNPQLNNSSPLFKHKIKVISRVPQSIYEFPIDVKMDPLLAELDFSQILDRIIIGPSPYNSLMSAAFSEALKTAGVHNVEKKIFYSGIPIRS